MGIEVEGTDEIREMASSLRSLFSSSALTKIAMKIARSAGAKLKEAVVQQCIEDIYELSTGAKAKFTPLNISEGYGGWTAERTNALKNAHELINEGKTQTVRINPSAAALPTPHHGREVVMDYAVPVHEGYVQRFKDGREVFHIGRPWFDHAYEKYGPVILEYVIASFCEAIEDLFEDI